MDGRYRHGDRERAALLAQLVGPAGRIIVLSNRGPITFRLQPEAPGGLTAVRGSGGLVTALAELGRHAALTWVAVAMSDGDRLAAPGLRPDATGPLAERVRDIVAQTLPDQDVQLRYETLNRGVFDRYYRAIANPFLWFVQHQMYASAYAPNVDEALVDAWLRGYRPANERLAEEAARAAADAGATRPIVLLQDYHLYLAAHYVRQLCPEATILHFTHIPWPPASQWQLLPQSMRRAICEGLLGCDIVGLQTDRYAANFIDSVASFVRDARVDRDGRTVAPAERRGRLRRLRASVRHEDLDWWLTRQLRDLAAVREGRQPPSRRLRDTVRRVESEIRG